MANYGYKKEEKEAEEAKIEVVDAVPESDYVDPSIKKKSEIIAKEETKKAQNQAAKVKNPPARSEAKVAEHKKENVEIAKAFGGITSSRIKTARG